MVTGRTRTSVAALWATEVVLIQSCHEQPPGVLTSTFDP